jgi:hypothetical protein
MKSKQRVIKTKSNNFVSDDINTQYQTAYMHPVSQLLPENGSGSGVTINDGTPAQTLNPVPTPPPTVPFEPPTPYAGADPILNEIPITTVAQMPVDTLTPPISPATQEHIKKNWWIYLLIAAAVVGLIVAYKKGLIK